MTKPEVISVENLAHYAKTIWCNDDNYDLNTMIIPGRIEIQHRHLDQRIGVRPNRRPFNTIFLFTEGELTFNIALNSYPLKPNDIVVIPENVINFTSRYKDVRGICIIFKTEYLFPLIKNNSITESFPYYEAGANHVASVSPLQADVVKTLFNDILTEYEGSSPDKHNIIKYYMEILLLKVKYFFNSPDLVKPENNSRAFLLTKKFKSLVEKNYLTKKSVAEYAGMLNISSKHLGETVKQTLGKTPIDLIQEMLLLEAKVLLRQTEMSVSEIAYKLNFDDHSYFSRFFRKHTMHSPQQYRESV